MSGTQNLKKGSAETLILSLVDETPLHGYGIAKLIEERSGGALRYHAASLYPILYRLERKGLLRGSWQKSSVGRRRRHYSLTAKGRKALHKQRQQMSSFIEALRKVAGLDRG